MKAQPKGHGLLIEPLAPTDYVSGDGKLSGEIINPDGDWTSFIVDWEHQAPRFETNGCASFAWVDALQALKKHHDGTTYNLSDRFLAKISGTDPARGNTPQKVAQTIRDNWTCLETDWPMQGVQTVEEYYQEPPDLLFSKATIIQDNDEFRYHAIANPTLPKIKEELKRGVVCMSVALLQDEDGKWYRPKGWTDTHWIWVLKVNDDGTAELKDTYEPFKKTVRADFLPQVAYRGNINEVQVDAFLALLKRLLARLIELVKPLPPVEVPVEKPRSKITEWALAIQHAEGGKPQDHNMKAHNPGNLKYTSYTASLGGTKGQEATDGGHFCKWPTYELGLKALCAFLKDACEGKLRSYKPDMSLDAFTTVFASVPSTHPYARNVAKRLGVSTSIPIKHLL